MSLVNVTLIVELLKNLLHLLFVVCISGTDKFIIRSIH